MPRRLGQHFLADAVWRQRILAALGVTPGEAWLEIGAGHGEMTHELLAAGAQVTAIELDPPLVAALGRLAQETPHLSVAAGDVLALDLTALLPARRGRQAGARVYGNLPYYITSPILARLFEHAAGLRSIHVVIQLEVALRIVAAPGCRDYGYFSVLCQYFSQPELIFRIPPGAFRPRPKVTSALVQLALPGQSLRLGLSNDAAFLDFVKVCFAHKRKTLANNLRGLLPVTRAGALLERHGLAAKVRAEELTVEQLAGLYRDCAGMVR